MPLFPLDIGSLGPLVTVLSLDGSKRLRLGVSISTVTRGGMFSSSESATGMKTAGARGLAAGSSSLNTTKPGSCIRDEEGVEVELALVEVVLDEVELTELMEAELGAGVGS